jgi:hypothetical protein
VLARVSVTHQNDQVTAPSAPLLLDKLKAWHREDPTRVVAALRRFSDYERIQLALACYGESHELALTVWKTIANPVPAPSVRSQR